MSGSFSGNLAVHISSVGRHFVCPSILQVQMRQTGITDWECMKVKNKRIEPSPKEQIGRASCRERVCLYV